MTTLSFFLHLFILSCKDHWRTRLSCRNMSRRMNWEADERTWWVCNSLHLRAVYHPAIPIRDSLLTLWSKVGLYAVFISQQIFLHPTLNEKKKILLPLVYSIFSSSVFLLSSYLLISFHVRRILVARGDFILPSTLGQCSPYDRYLQINSDFCLIKTPSRTCSL